MCDDDEDDGDGDGDALGMRSGRAVFKTALCVRIMKLCIDLNKRKISDVAEYGKNSPRRIVKCA